MKKILILSANPKNTSNLRLDEEVREIKNTLQLSPHRNEFKTIAESAVQVEDLTRQLSHHQPTIVHFSGHGTYTDELAFEDKFGQQQLVSTQALAKLFDLFQQQIECIVLNACYSETQADSIHQHIDCVIGMNKAIGDKAAIKFSIGFYTALFSNRDYQDSFHMGCAAIDLQGIPEYATPQIKIRRSRYLKEEKINPVKSDKNNNINNDNQASQNRSVSMGGSASITGGAIITGENSTANIKNQNQQVSLPAPESVNIQAEINALREIIGQLESSDRLKINNAFTEAQEELNKPQPDKDEIGEALNRALKYAKKVEGFASAIAKLQPHLSKITVWLGENWHQLLNLVGLTT